MLSYLRQNEQKPRFSKSCHPVPNISILSSFNLVQSNSFNHLLFVTSAARRGLGPSHIFVLLSPTVESPTLQTPKKLTGPILFGYTFSLSNAQSDCLSWWTVFGRHFEISPFPNGMEYFLASGNHLLSRQVASRDDIQFKLFMYNRHTKKEEHMNVSAIHLMCRFMTLCVADPIWGVCCYSYTPSQMILA